MYYRPLGKTGALVSEVGMGCNRLGQGDAPDGHWVQLVRRAVELGVTVFDSSESYGWGRSEKMLGQALGNRDDVLVATKVSRARETNEKDFAARRVIEEHGGKVTGSVSSRTDYLLIGESPGGSKTRKAQVLDISQISEDELRAMIAAG